MDDVKEGFEPIFRTSPFIDLLGPIYSRQGESAIAIGFRVEAKHCNARGLLHGGVISGVADIALGYNAAFQADPPTPLVTASLTVDYAGVAKLGDWVEVHVDVQKVGKKLAFANAYFLTGEQRIARASAVFSVI
ncbi:MAG: PaaI family thioesterase [Rubrivivax sp.]|nr:MAG: PaaI family thioesterase [Rubrivivax sp.]